MLVAGGTYVEKTTPVLDGLQLSIFRPLAGERDGELVLSTQAVN